MWTDRRTDVRHINLIGGLVTRNPPNKAMVALNRTLFSSIGQLPVSRFLAAYRRGAPQFFFQLTCSEVGEDM